MALPQLVSDVPRATQLVFLDGAQCARKCYISHELKYQLERLCYKVYHQNDFVEQNIPVEEMKRGRTEELQRIGLILTHYATGRMTQALEQLELSVNYQFHYSQPLLRSTLEMCRTIVRDLYVGLDMRGKMTY
jgi:hypothetical protein